MSHFILEIKDLDLATDLSHGCETETYKSGINLLNIINSMSFIHSKHLLNVLISKLLLIIIHMKALYLNMMMKYNKMNINLLKITKKYESANNELIELKKKYESKKNKYKELKIENNKLKLINSSAMTHVEKKSFSFSYRKEFKIIAQTQLCKFQSKCKNPDCKFIHNKDEKGKKRERDIEDESHHDMDNGRYFAKKHDGPAPDFIRV